MYIGQVSEKTGASQKAIRLYEEMGLIPTPLRKGKYRFFSNLHVELIIIIKQAQSLGFKLSEIKKSLKETNGCNDFPWEKAITLLQNKINSNILKISEIKVQNNKLKSFIKALQKKKCEF